MLQYRVFQVPVLLCTLSIDVIHALQHLRWEVNCLRYTAEGHEETSEESSGADLVARAERSWTTYII